MHSLLPLLCVTIVLWSKGGNAGATVTTKAGDSTHHRRTTEKEFPLVQPRIVGGTEAIPDRYPYTVSLQDAATLSHYCGGSLVAPDMVLTAAHCLYYPGHQLAVRLRPYSLRDPDADVSEIFSVRKAHVHPDYYDAGLNPLRVPYRDVVLLQLNGTSTKSSVFLAVNNDAAVPEDDQMLTVMGWGDVSGNNDEYPDTLQVLEDGAEYRNNERCKQDILNEFPNSQSPGEIKDGMLCTFEGRGEGSCQGDSGGPLVVRGQNAEEDVQVGLVSWGSSCSNRECRNA